MNIIDIYQANQTVFTIQELSQLFPDDSPAQLNNALHYAVKTDKLKRIRRGIYAKSNYSMSELANSLFIPSYVSLETILRAHGVVFQADSSIQSVSYLSRTVVIEGQKLSYRKLKYSILSNPLGLVVVGHETKASLERAFLDSLMVFKNYHFDNLAPINWDIVDTLLPIYQSQILSKKVAQLRRVSL